MSKKSKVIIALCLCLCMVSSVMPCFSLPVSAASDTFDIDDWWKYGPTYYDNATENFVMFDCRLDNGYYYRYFFYNHTSADSSFDLAFSFNGSALTVKSTSAYEIGYAFGVYDPSTGSANAGADNRYFTGSKDLIVWDYEDIDLDWYNFRYYASGDSTVTLDGIEIEQYDYLYYTFPSLEYGPRGYVLPWCFSQYHVVYTQSNNNGGYEPPIFYMFTNNKNTYLSFRDSGSVIDYGLFSTDNSTVGGYSDVVVFHTSKPDYGDYTVARVNVGTWYELPLFGPDLGNVLYSELPVYLVEVSASDGSSGGSVDVVESTNPQNATTDDIVETLEHLETVVSDSAQSVVDKVESSTVQVTEKIDESTGKITYEIQDSTDKIIQNDDENTDKIVGAVGDAAGQVTDKLDDIYNGEFPHELPTYDNDVDTESSDDLSEVSSSLLDSAKVDTSIFDAIRNLDWDGVPLVGRFMTLVIDLGFADVVVYCLSMGLGLAILGKRFG